MMSPLHSSLGNKARSHPPKKKDPFKVYRALCFSCTISKHKLPTMMAVTPQYFDMYFLQTRGIFLGEKKQKTGKLTLLHFSLLILRSHSGFAGCPSNVLYSENIQLFLTYRVYLSGLLSPFQSEGSLSVFTVHSIPPS